MRKAAIEGKKRDEIEQFTALANLLRPRPGGEWPAPDDVDAMELGISRASDPAELEQRRDALLDPLWKAAHRLFPALASDPWPRSERYDLIVLHRLSGVLHSFRQREAAELYRCAWLCRKWLITIAAAAGNSSAYGTTWELPPAPRRFQIVAGKLMPSSDFRDFFMGALEGFDVSMIRVCDCWLIFIAKRHAQSGCSKRCANRQRQQKFRAGNPGYHRRHARAGRMLEAFRRAITVVATIPEPFPEVA
jgi:hypothetical protein